MKLYLIRFSRYILRMVLLLAIVFVVLHFTGMLNTGGASLAAALFTSTRGFILIGVLLLFALTYPKVSFMSSPYPADIRTDREAIIGAFRDYGYSLKDEKPGEMKFRADKMTKRLLTMFDDTITVTQDGSHIEIEGQKKDVPRVELRLNSHFGR